MSDGDQQASSISNANSGVSQRNSPNSPGAAKARMSPASNASAINTSTSPEIDNGSGTSTSPASAAMKEQQLLSAHYISGAGGGMSTSTMSSSVGPTALATPGTFIVWIHNVSPTQRYTVMRPDRNATAQEVLEQVLERTYQIRTPRANDYLLVVERLVSTALDRKRRNKKNRSKSAHQQQKASATARLRGFLRDSLSPRTRRSTESEETAATPKRSLAAKQLAGDRRVEQQQQSDEPEYAIRHIIHRNEVLFDVAKNLPQASRIAMRRVSELLGTHASKCMSDMDVRGLQSASAECILSLGQSAASALSRPRPSITASEAADGSGTGSGSGSGFDIRRCSTASEPNRPRSLRPSFLYAAGQTPQSAMEHKLAVPASSHSHQSATGRKRSSTTERGGATSTSSGGHSAVTSPDVLSLPQSKSHTARSSPSTPASGVAGTTGTSLHSPHSPRSHKTSACTCAGATEQKRGSQSEENLMAKRISPPDCQVHLGPSRAAMTTTSELPPHPIRQRANTASGSSIREILLHNLRRSLARSPPIVENQMMGASSEYTVARTRTISLKSGAQTNVSRVASASETAGPREQRGRHSRSSPEEAAAMKTGSPPGSRNSTGSGSSSSGHQRASQQHRPHKLSVPMTIKRIFKGNRHDS